MIQHSGYQTFITPPQHSDSLYFNKVNKTVTKGGWVWGGGGCSPGGTLVSVETGCVVYQPCLVLFSSTQGAALPPRNPLKGAQTGFVENMGAGEQDLRVDGSMSGWSCDWTGHSDHHMTSQRFNC